MNHRLTFLVCVAIFLLPNAMAQPSLDQRLQSLEAELKEVQDRELELIANIEGVKLQLVQQSLKELGMPRVEAGEEVIIHSAMALVYDETHEQAKWVAHIITPDVLEGNVSRTNDFRPDPKVASGSAEEADYFLKYLQPDSSYTYDGYGHDRGHLAPSADFRWSQQALSESYFYSNMSPQAPDLNRGRWAELEGMLRAYLARFPQTQLHVVTGPILSDDLPKVARSVNGLSLPKAYFKVVLDHAQQRGIAFLFPNKACPYPVESYAVSIDSVEALTGLDFFPALADERERLIEAQRDPTHWLPDAQQTDALPLDSESLPKNCFNTLTARSFANTGAEVSICGTVVSTKLTGNGHIFLNLDKKFPNQIFTVAIWKDQRINFSYEPHIDLMGRKICVEGQVQLSQGTPTMSIETEKAITFFEEP